MIKRLFFHLFHFVILALLIFLSAYIYFALTYPRGFALYSIVIAYKFIVGKIDNFALVLVLTYFLSYAGGIIKFTIEEKIFRMVAYFREVFKFLVILGMVSFLEFFLFYQGRFGRLMYVYLFVLYSVYYYIYRLIRYPRGPRSLLWLAHVPSHEILEKYLSKPRAFQIYTEADVPPQRGRDIHVVYQDGCLDERASEALIKNKLAGHTVVELVELVEKEAGKIPVEYVNIHWFLDKFDVVDSNYFRTSRIFNILLSFILIIILFPIGLLTALIHRCFSPGPLFFVQDRIGLHGRTFRLIKFRTMVKNAEENGAQFSGKNDFRITSFGKYMRRLRLDEIPQLFNVLKGQMSMVGPRPEREIFIENLSKDIPYYKLRLLVPPGLTGWAQVNGVYAGNNIEDHKEKLEYDLYYIKNRNLFMDIQVLLRTIKTIIQAKGE